MSDPRKKGDERRTRNAARMREQTAAVSDIGEIPPVVNPERRAACERDLNRFLCVYFPNSTGLSPFSADHNRIIARLQRCILDGGRFVSAVYRGAAKTTIAENAALWATLNGHRKFIPLFGADSAASGVSLDSIKSELSENDLLYDDFPEICHPVRHLEGRAQRCGSQSYRGELTGMEWNAEMIRFPAIAGAAGAEAAIVTRGILSGFRGLKYKRKDGTQQRPDCVLLDDIQTDESASTPLQVAKTLRTLRKAIGRLGGHRRGLAMVCNATVIQPDDAIDQLLDDPAWQGERIPMVRKMPDALKTLWLDAYATIRRTFDRDGIDDQKRAHKQATAFYEAHREEMDAGAEVSWESCYTPDDELSALQHAINILIDDGEEAFASECQNRPLRPETEGIQLLSVEQICGKLNGIARGELPAHTAHLTAAIDVHETLLVWTVCAWEPDFTGAVVAYGTWPRQQIRNWSLRRASPTLLEKAPPGAGKEGAIRHGLEVLTGELMAREWKGETGAGLRIGRLLIDSGYLPDLVLDFARHSPHASVILPSKGFSIGAKKRPFEHYTRHPQQQFGLHWYITRVGQRSVRQVQIDTYFWKSFLYARLALSPGDRGALTLFQAKPEEHRLFAEHLTSERPVLVEANGRKVHEWELMVGADNHWLDTTVYCCVAASERGAVLPGAKVAPARKVMTMAEMQSAAQQRRGR